MSDIDVTPARTQADLEAVLDIRRRVFVEEQGVPIELEIDEHDIDPVRNTRALHVLGRVDGQAVATGRCVLEGERHAHLGRIAVLAEHRGEGYGRSIVLALHELARERGCDSATLGAQLHAIGFYEGLGYVARGDVYLDAGIEHRWMDVRL